jgi:hypothetical protein
MRIKIFVLVVVTGLLIAGAADSALAQSLDKRTYFTFTAPVTVPGVTLPAGKYIFRVATTTQRDVLQVLSADGDTSYAMFFALRIDRSDAESVPTSELRFMETPEGTTPAIDSWWYPSERVGYEFIYPKAQALALAARVGHPVLTTEDEFVTATAAPALVTPTGEEQTFEPAPFPATEPAVRGEPVPPSLQIAEARTELPRTASTFPVFLVAGLGLLLSAAALKGMLR